MYIIFFSFKDGDKMEKLRHALKAQTNYTILVIKTEDTDQVPQLNALIVYTIMIQLCFGIVLLLTQSVYLSRLLQGWQ